MIKKIKQRIQQCEYFIFDGHNGGEIKKWSDGKIIESPVLEITDSNPTGEYLQISNQGYTAIAIVGDVVWRDATGAFMASKGDDRFWVWWEEVVPEPEREVKKETNSALKEKALQIAVAMKPYGQTNTPTLATSVYDVVSEAKKIYEWLIKDEAQVPLKNLQLK